MLKKSLTTLLFFAFLLSFTHFTPTAEASGSLVKIIDAKTVIVREEASDTSKKLLTLSQGYYVTQLSSAKGWAKVRAGKTTGYIKLDSLKVKNFDRKKVTASTNVQQTASKNATTLIKIQKGAVVEHYGSASNGWSFVKYGGTTGYVPSKNLTVVSSTTKYLKSSDTMYNLPTTSGIRLATINAYTKVNVLSTVEDYSYVKSGENYGYIRTSNLVMYMAFAKDYFPKCKNFDPKKYICKNDSHGYTTIYKNLSSQGPDAALDAEVGASDYKLTDGYLIISYYNGGYNIPFPLYKGKIWEYKIYGGGIDVYIKSEVISMNETLKVHNKTYTNVIKIKNIIRDEYGAYLESEHIQIIPGLGEYGKFLH